MYGTGDQPLYSPGRRTNRSPSPNSNIAPLFQRQSQQQQSLPTRASTLPISASKALERQSNVQEAHAQQGISDIQQHIETSQQPPIPRSYSTGDLKASIRAGDQQTKVVSENIQKIENHFPQFVQDINLYTVRSAKLRDAGDNFARSLQEYAQSEAPALKQGLSGFAECFAAVQDHRNVLVTRLENKVLQSFSVYETRCKQAKIDVKQHNVAHVKELNEHKSYEKVRGKSTQQFELAKAEAKFKKASEEANRSAYILSDQITDFERQKVVDLKNVFGEFMLSEMLFFSKALEIYTRAYQEIMNVDEEEDIEQLQESMKLVTHDFGNPETNSKQQSMYTSAPSIMQSNMQQNAAKINQNYDRTL